MARASIREPDFDPTAFDIRDVLKIGLAARADTFKTYDPKGWRSSSLGYCLRRQFFERAGVPEPSEELEDFRSSRRLWIGELIHSGVQRLFADSGLLLVAELALEDAELDLQGHVDMVWGGPQAKGLTDDDRDLSPKFEAFLQGYRHRLDVLYDGKDFPVCGTELKSAASYSAEKMFSEGPQFNHVIQVASYALMYDRGAEVPDILKQHPIERWEIAVISKQDGLMPVFPVLRSHLARVEDRLGALNAYWSERQVPPCTCGVDISWEKGYCKYGEGPRPFKGCCREGLIEGATNEAFWEGVS